MKTSPFGLSCLLWNSSSFLGLLGGWSKVQMWLRLSCGMCFKKISCSVKLFDEEENGFLVAVILKLVFSLLPCFSFRSWRMPEITWVIGALLVRCFLLPLRVLQYDECCWPCVYMSKLWASFFERRKSSTSDKRTELIHQKLKQLAYNHGNWLSTRQLRLSCVFHLLLF